MHEYGIACEIGEVVLAEARRHGASKVSRVTLRVGVLRGIVPDQLRFIFEQVVRGTIAEGALLAIEEDPVVVRCADCGTSLSRSFVMECPRCRGPVTGGGGGEALEVISIDVD